MIETLDQERIVTIDDLLTKIARLLDANGESGWAKAFRNLLSDDGSDPDAARGRIRSVYGEMGSFNDLILHDSNGVPLRDANDELNRLRSELFRLCR